MSLAYDKNISPRQRIKSVAWLGDKSSATFNKSMREWFQRYNNPMGMLNFVTAMV